MSWLFAWWFAVWHPYTAPQPRPQLTPAEVVRIVVAALENCNSPIPNAGVFTAYQFASPANHAVTGPYGHFIGLVKSRDFAPLLRPYPTAMGPMALSGGHAEQVVTVHNTGNRDAAFKFTLSIENDGRNRGCWMVDGVVRM